ncbi:MAG: restriction endonuclease [Saprospiraceae bacterium]|nr:restriction endonuclease [Saprospiraceae bacterium]
MSKSIFNNLQIAKTSGQYESFDEEKLRRSLRRSGAEDAVVNEVLQELRGQLHDGMSTQTIYKRAFKMLKRLHRPTAGRYTLKQAMFDFGATGFPFEDFFAEIMRSQGYQVKTRQLLPGACIQHEVDVVAESDETIIWVECKYHPMAGSVSNVKIPLYVHSRFRDLENNRSLYTTAHDTKSVQGWIATNSRFSDDAMTYGRCAALHLVSWNYPAGGSLRDIIDQSGLYPITCLTTLNWHEKKQLLEKSIVLCKWLSKPGDWSEILHLSDMRIRRVMEEAQSLCKPVHEK